MNNFEPHILNKIMPIARYSEKGRKKGLVLNVNEV